jgi:adenylate cyclase
MDRFARAFRAGAAANGHDFGATRIGVHSGGATVGNFGGAARMEYMAHGDVVNTVARLEGANKFLNTSIVVSESTARLVRTASLRPVAELGLVGRSTRLAVFEPVQAGALLTLQEYMSAYDLLRRGAPEARAAFEALHARDPADGVVRLHLERLRHGASGVIIRLESK